MTPILCLVITMVLKYIIETSIVDSNEMYALTTPWIITSNPYGPMRMMMGVA